MKISFNPFYDLSVKKEGALVIRLASSLRKKLFETFCVCFGTPSHLGIFDYLTLFVPTLMLYLFSWCIDDLLEDFSSRKLLTGIIIIPVAIITLILFIPRGLFSILTTLFISPIVIVLHEILRDETLVKADNFVDIRNDIEIIAMLDLVGTTDKGEIKFINEYLNESQLTINDFNITVEQARYQKHLDCNDIENYQIRFDFKKSTFSNKPSFFISRLDKECNLALHSLFKLNVGQILNHNALPNEILESIYTPK